jgi:hypothetical protein
VKYGIEQTCSPHGNWEAEREREREREEGREREIRVPISPSRAHPQVS